MFAHWLRKLLPTTAPARRKPTRPAARPNLVQLEDRSNPAVTAALAGGTLTVTLSAANDSAFLQVNAGKVEVDDEPTFGAPQVAGSPFAGVTKIVVADGGANAGQSVTFAGAGTFTLTGGLQATGGVETVNINAPVDTTGGTLAIDAATALNTTAAITTGGVGTILSANTMSLGAAVNAGGGTVTLRPVTAGTKIDLGGPDVAGTTLGLTKAEINFVTAGVLRVGNANAGDVTVTAAIAPAGTGQLEVTTGGAILDGSAADPDLTVARLALAAGTGIGTGGANTTLEINAANLEASTTAGGAKLSNQSVALLTIGGVTGAGTALSVGGGDLELVSAGSVTVTKAVAVTGGGNLTVFALNLTLNAGGTVAASGGNGSVFLRGSNDLTSSAAVTAAGAGNISALADNDADGAGNFTTTAGGTFATAGGAIDLRGADIDLGDTVNATATGVVTVAPTKALSAIDLGTDGVGFGFTDADVDLVTAGVLRVGTANAGAINVSAPISVNGLQVPTLSLISGATITDAAAGGIAAQNLALAAGTGVTLDSAANNVNAVAGTVTGAGDFTYVDTNGVAVDTADGVTGITTANGNVNVTTTAGVINLVALVSGQTAGNIVTLNAGGAIVDGNGAANNVTATNLALVAATGIGTAADPVETTVSNIEATTATGGVFVANTGNLAVGNVSAALNGVRATTSGDIVLTSAGSISVVTGGERVEGLANVTVTAIGAAADIQTGGFQEAIQNLSAGTVTVTAGRDILMGILGVSYGDINANQFGDASPANAVLVAGRDVILQGTNSSFLDVGNGGTASVTAGRNISVGADGSNSHIQTASGLVTLQAGAGGVFSLGSGFVRSTSAGSGADIIISADDMVIGAAITAGTGTVTLKTVSAATAIDLGTNTAGKLGLTDPELDFITAAGVVVGDATNTGGITVSAALTPANAPNLTLLTGTDIAVNDNVTVTGGFVAKAGNTFTLAATKAITVGAGKALAIEVDTIGAVDAAGGTATISGDLVGATPATLTGGGDNDAFVVALPAAGLSSDLAVTGNAGNDTLNVKLGTVASLAKAISFDGGTGGGILRVTGNGSQTATALLDPAPGNVGKGSVTVGANAVTFTSLQPVDLVNFTTVNVAFNFAGVKADVGFGKDFLTNTKDALRVTPSAGGTAFESLAIWVTTNLNIDTTTKAGTDTVTLTGTNGTTHANKNLSITTGNETGDAVAITGDSAVTGTFTALTGGTITLAASKGLTAGGDVTLKTGPDVAATPQGITLSAGSSVTSAAGNVTISSADDLTATGAALISAATAGKTVALAIDAGGAEGASAELVGVNIVSAGGAATLTGGGGNDFFHLSKYTAALNVDGAAGTDKVCLAGTAIVVNGNTGATVDGGGPITFTNIEQLCFDPGVADLTVIGTTGDDIMILETNAGAPFYTLNGFTVPLPTGLATFTFDGQDGNDTLVTRYTTAADALVQIAKAITYDGQGKAGQSDKLAVVGKGTQRVRVNLAPTALDNGQGTVADASATLTFLGLEPVDVRDMAQVWVTFAGGQDAVTVAAGKLFTSPAEAALIVSGKTGGLTFESVALRNNTAVYLDTTTNDAAGDTVTFNASGPATDHLNANVTTNTGTGAGDAVAVAAAVNVSGNFTVSGFDLANNVFTQTPGTGGTVTVAAALTAGGQVYGEANGGVTVTAAGVASAGGALTLQSDAGSVAVNAGGVVTSVGTLRLVAAADVLNNGQVTGTGQAFLTAGGTVVNDSTIRNGTVTLTGTDIINTLAESIDGRVLFTAANTITSNTALADNNATTVANGGAIGFTATNGTINSTTATAPAGGIVFATAGGKLFSTTATAGEAIKFNADGNITNNTAKAGTDVTFTSASGSVTNTGAVTGTAGAVTFTAKTTVDNQAAGTLKAGTDVFLSGPAGVTNAAGVTAGNNVTLTAANGTVTNSGAVTATAKAVTFTAGDKIANNAGGVLKAGTDVTLTAANELTNADKVTAAGNVTFTSTAKSITNSGAVTATAGDVFFSAKTDVTNTGTLTAGQDVKFLANALVLNNNVGSITAARDVIFQATTDVTNQGLGGTVSAGRDLKFIAGGNMTNNAAVTAVRDVVFTAAGTVTNAAAVTATTGAVAFTAGNQIANNAGGVLKAGTDVTLTAANELTNADKVTATGNVTFTSTAKSATNAAAVTATTGAVAFTAGTTVTNNAAGTLTAGTAVTLTGPAGVGNAAGVTAGGGVNFTATGGAVTNSGAVGAGGSVGFFAGAGVVNSGAVTAGGDAAFTATGGDVTTTANVTTAGFSSIYLTSRVGQVTASGTTLTAGGLVIVSAGTNLFANGTTFSAPAFTVSMAFDTTNAGATADLRNATITTAAGKAATLTGGTGDDVAQVTLGSALAVDLKAGTDRLEVTGNPVVLTDRTVGPVGYINTELVLLVNATDLTVNGDSFGTVNDKVTVSKAAATYNLAVNAQAVSAPALAKLAVNGLLGNDCLILDPTMLGTAVFANGIGFDGGAGSDAVSVTGTGAEQAVFTPTAAGTSGKLVVGANALNLSGTEGLDLAKFGKVTVAPAAATNVLTLGPGQSVCVPVNSLVLSGTTGGAVLTKVAVSQTGTFAVDLSGTGGDDSLAFNAVNNGHGVGAVTFDAGPGTDTLTYDAANQAVTATANSFTAAGVPLTYTNVETVTLANATKAVTVNGGAGDDILSISKSGAAFVYQFTGSPQVTLATFPASFAFNGLAGKDQLNVRYAGGDPVPAGGVAFDGGADADTGLLVFGTGAEAVAVTSNPAGAALAGTVKVNGGTITFANVDAASQVDVTKVAAVTVGFGTGDDKADINNGFDVTAGGAKPALVISPVAGPPAFAKVAVWNTPLLTLDTTGADGADAITVTRADNAHNVTNLVINTGAGADSVTFNGPAVLAGTLTVRSKDTAVRQTTITAGGSTTFTTAGTLTLDGATVKTGGAFLQDGAGAVALAGASTIAATADVQINGRVDGPGGLTVNNATNVVFVGAVGSATPLADLTTDAGGTTRFDGGTVRTTGAQTYNDAVTFTKSTAFTTAGGNLTFNAAAGGPGGVDLTLAAGGGDIQFAADLGSPLSLLRVASARDMTFNGAVAATTFIQDAGTGTTAFKQKVTLTGSGVALNATTKNLTAATDVEAKNGDVRLNLTGDATFGGPLTTRALTQANNGAGTTTFNGPVNLAADANLATGRAVFNNAFNATAGTVTLALANGAAEGAAGAVATTVLTLTGAGTFQLDAVGNDVTAATGGLFAALDSGGVLFRDANDLVLRLRADGTSAVTIGGANAVLELTAAGLFDAQDTSPANRFATPLFNLGDPAAGGAVRVFPGVGVAAGAANKVFFVAEVKAKSVTLGTVSTTDPNSPDFARANKGKDTFTVRPSVTTPITVNGNDPTRATLNGQAGDTLVPVFTGFVTASPALARTGDDGSYTSQTGKFQPLNFTSIETIGGLSLDAFVIQTAPRDGAAGAKQYAVRLAPTQTAVDPSGNAQPVSVQLTGSVKGNGAVGNPFIVSPQAANAVQPFGSPHLALGDVNGDGTTDLIIANGPDDLGIVTVLDGRKLIDNPTPIDLANIDPTLILAQFFPYEQSFNRGIVVAVADLDGDGKAEIITGPLVGGGQRVRVFSVLDPVQLNAGLAARGLPQSSTVYNNTYQYDGRQLGYTVDASGTPQPAPGGREYRLLQRAGGGNFFAFNEAGTPDEFFRGGVNVAAGDVDGDGVIDLVVGAGVGGGPRVQVYSGASADVTTPIRNYFAYDPNFRGGVFVDAGNFDGDNLADILTAPGSGGGPEVKVFAGSNTDGIVPARVLADFMAFPTGGSLVASDANLNGVGGIAFGSSVDGTQSNRALLVVTPRGTAVQVLRFVRNADGTISAPSDLIRLKNQAGTQVFIDPLNPDGTPNPQAIGVNPDLLRDGGSVAGFGGNPNGTGTGATN